VLVDGQGRKGHGVIRIHFKNVADNSVDGLALTGQKVDGGEQQRVGSKAWPKFPPAALSTTSSHLVLRFRCLSNHLLSNANELPVLNDTTSVLCLSPLRRLGGGKTFENCFDHGQG